MNTTIWDELAKGLQSELNSTDVKPKVYRMPPQKFSFDCVILEEVNNQYSGMTTCGRERIDELDYEINIYIASNGASTEDTIRSKDREISSVCDKYMTSNGFFRTSSNITPNVDSTIFRRTLRYNGKIKINTGKIIR